MNSNRKIEVTYSRCIKCDTVYKKTITNLITGDYMYIGGKCPHCGCTVHTRKPTKRELTD